MVRPGHQTAEWGAKEAQCMGPLEAAVGGTCRRRESRAESTGRIVPVDEAGAAQKHVLPTRSALVHLEVLRGNRRAPPMPLLEVNTKNSTFLKKHSLRSTHKGLSVQ